GTAHSLAITGDLPEGTNVSYEDNSLTDVGSQTVTATVTGGNYTTLELTATLAVTPTGLTVTADADQSKVYGQTDPTLTYTLTAGELVGEDAFTGTLERVAGEAVGSYAITQGGLSAGDNYDITFTGTEFAITPATVTGIEFNGDSFVYDGTAHS